MLGGQRGDQRRAEPRLAGGERQQAAIEARTYDRDLSHLLALQGEIAREIADEIQFTLGDRASSEPGHASPSYPATYEAYDLYLRGQYFWNKRTVEGFQQAIAYFEKAIAKDPNYARAYAGCVGGRPGGCRRGKVRRSRESYIGDSRAAGERSLHKIIRPACGI